MSLQVLFQRRNFQSFQTHNSLQVRVKRMRWNAQGGCDEAELEVRGPIMQLWDMLDWLRYGVEIVDETAASCWWGYVHEVQVGVGRFQLGASLDTMYNRVAVAYSLVETDRTTIGYRKTTAWAENTESSGEYGQRDFLSTQGNLSDAAATARRDAILEAHKYPIGTCNPFSGGAVATLVCRGWFETLRWQNASIAAVPGAAYSTTSATEQALGSASSNTKVMMVIGLNGRSMAALGLQVYARKQGSPVDNLILSLYRADEDTDAPVGSALGSVSLAGGSLTGSLAWVGGNLSAAKQMLADKDYCLVVSRSGAADAGNYYVINVNTALGYTGGFFKIWNGSAWVDRSPNADMPFVITVNNSVESTSQLRELALTFGEFISAVSVDAESGILLPSYRDGDTTTLVEIQALLESGGPNGRRLLASVDRDRRLLVWEEPSRESITYSLTSSMDLLENGVRKVSPTRPPVGVWCRLVDVIPGVVDVVRLNHPEVQFIEGASWDAGQGLSLEFRGTGNIEDFLKVQR